MTLTRLLLTACLTLALCPGPVAASAAEPAPAANPLDPAMQWQPISQLSPFTGTYQAFYKGKLAGDATLALSRTGNNHWQVSLEVRGKRGFAGVLGLNLLQTTEFEEHNGQFRPLSQLTERRGLFLGKKVRGSYDWAKGTAQWQGDIERKRRAPVALQPGDLSALLINLAIMRDATPGAQMQYRYADVGRLRLHQYQADPATAVTEVSELSYDALRVQRSNSRPGDALTLWLANGVPTPIRISQREDGEDTIDLQLIEYQGEQQ